MTNTNHIKSCRNAYHEHAIECPVCQSTGPCAVGVVLLDELCNSIANHKDVENLSGTEAEPCATIKI